MRLTYLLIVFVLFQLNLIAGPVPQDFAGPQSPTKPAPFKVEYVDQGTFDPKLKGILAPAGFKLEIVADYPNVVNPVGMTFTPDGTPFILEWAADPTSNGNWFEFKEITRYRDGTSRPVSTMKKFVLDPCKQFTINPKTGQFEQPKIAFTDELPSSLLYHDGWLYTASRGTVRRFKQSIPGGPWDTREIIAQGFCGFHHHQVSGLSIGNDGLLYITSGDDDNVAEGSDGSRATVMRTGVVFRCKPDGSHMEMYSLGYRNPYRDLAQDENFNWFHVDNDNEDGSKFTGCRLMHVCEGVDYGWRLRIGARCCQPDHLRGAVAGELPGKLPPMLKTGRGSPAGLLIYNDTKLPEQYRGLAFYPDVFRKLVRAYRFAPNESTFAVSHEFEFLKSEDPLFRPCQMVTGPDGAIYCVDWRANSGGAGKLWGDNEHGRIYRITFAGTKDIPAIPTRPMNSWLKLLFLQNPELTAALGSPDFSDRLIARNELVRRGQYATLEVLTQFAKLPKIARLPALGVLQQNWNADIQTLFISLLADSDHNVRRTVIDALAQHVKVGDAVIHDALVKCLRDPNPTVRRVAAHAVARVSHDAASILAAWKAEESKDPFLIDAYIRGIERCEKEGVNALITLAESGNGPDFDRAVTAFCAMRTRPFGDALLKMLSNVHASEGQRVALLRSIPNYQDEPPLPLEPFAEFLTQSTKLTVTERVVGLEVLSGGGLTGNAGAKLVLSLLNDESWEVRSAAIAAADSQKLKAAGPALLDWAIDTKRPTEERVAAIKALRTTGDASMAGILLFQLAGKAPTYLKTEVLRTAMTFNPAMARIAAEGLLDHSDQALVAEAVSILGSTKPGAKIVGERFVDGKLPKNLLPRIAEAVRNHAVNDPAYQTLYDNIMRGGLKLTSAEASRMGSQVAFRGSAVRGKDLYLNATKLACVTCHRMEGVGGQIGPDLTRLWDTMTVEKIIESILEPSKEIKEGYQSYQATTFSGGVFTGLKVSESSTDVVLREATGRDNRIMKTDLDTLAPSKISLMPDNALSQLSYDQVLDLIAFLKSKKEQESLRGLVREYAVRRDDGKSTPGNDPLAEGIWTVKAVETGNVLNWKSAFTGPSGPAYALTYVWSAADQKGNVLLTTDDAVQVFVRNQSTFLRSTPAAAGYVAEEIIPVTWKAGWNPVLVKLIKPGVRNQLLLKAGGDGVRTASKPEK